ncbi:MAG TPA: hypothetical protein VH300_15600 [Thermoleophilaceae bacterium]|nr:hypothetical protein [Thermoleophilaceae bacterium]
MAIDRAGARRRVRTVTAWAAAGAAAMTAAFAFGAARGTHAATGARSRSPARARDVTPPVAPPQAAAPQGGYPQSPYPGNGGSDSGQGFQPPSSSTGPPAGTSGGS